MSDFIHENAETPEPDDDRIIRELAELPLIEYDRFAKIGLRRLGAGRTLWTSWLQRPE